MGLKRVCITYCQEFKIRTPEQHDESCIETFQSVVDVEYIPEWLILTLNHSDKNKEVAIQSSLIRKIEIEEI